MFVPFLTAPEGSTVCTHAVNCMPLWPAPLKSIHCYSSPPSTSLCLSECTCFGWWSEMPCGGPVLWKHELWIIKDDNIKTHRTQLSLHSSPLCFHFSSFPLSVFSTFLLSLCSSGWPGCFETMMCSDICNSGRGEEQKHCWLLSVWLNGWWQSISSQLSGSDTVSGDQSPICDE